MSEPMNADTIQVELRELGARIAAEYRYFNALSAACDAVRLYQKQVSPANRQHAEQALAAALRLKPGRTNP